MRECIFLANKEKENDFLVQTIDPVILQCV